MAGPPGQAEDIRLAELERFRGKLDGLDEAKREAVEALTKGILAKLLPAGPPLPSGRRLAGTPTCGGGASPPSRAHPLRPVVGGGAGSPFICALAREVRRRRRHAARPSRRDGDAVIVETTGDQQLDRPIWEIPGAGRVREGGPGRGARRSGRHRRALGQDLPSVAVDGLVLAGVPEQGSEPRDALVGSTLADLPTGALVATGSVRRRPSWPWLRPTSPSPDCAASPPVWPGPGLRRHRRWPRRHRLRHTQDAGRRRCSPPTSCCLRWARGRWRSRRAGDATALEALALLEHAPAGSRSGRAGFLAELGGDCDLPPAPARCWRALGPGRPGGGAARVARRPRRPAGVRGPRPDAAALGHGLARRLPRRPRRRPSSPDVVLPKRKGWDRAFLLEERERRVPPDAASRIRPRSSSRGGGTALLLEE